MNKKGFTLIELLGVLLLITIISLIAFLVVDKSTKSGKQEMYNKQIEMIELAAKNWASDNLTDLPINYGESTLSLLALRIAGYIDIDVFNPITGECFSNETEIIIKNTGNNYEYTVVPRFVNVCEVYDPNKPQISIISHQSLIGVKEGYNVATFTIIKNSKDIFWSQEKPTMDYISLISKNDGINRELDIDTQVTITPEENNEIHVTVHSDEPEGEIQVLAKSGIVSNSQGTKNDDTYSKIVYVDATPPNVEEVFVGSKCDSLNKTGNNCITYYSNEPDYKFCMFDEYDTSTLSSTNINSVYDAAMYVELKINDNFSKSYFYEEKLSTNSKSDFELTKSNSIDKNLISRSIQNGTIKLKICDTINNCREELSYSLNYNDCKNPSINSAKSDSTLIKNYFIDEADEDEINVSSDMATYGVVVTTDASSTFKNTLTSMIISSGLVLDSVINDLSNAGYLAYFNDSSLREISVSDLKSNANTDLNKNEDNRLNRLDGDVYLFLIGMDFAGNFTIDRINLGNYCTYPVDSSQCSGPSIDYVCPVDGGNNETKCKMMQNSIKWHEIQYDSTKTDAEKKQKQKELHDANITLSNDYNGEIHYNSSDGFWYEGSKKLYNIAEYVK